MRSSNTMGVGPTASTACTLNHSRATTWPVKPRSARRGSKSSPVKRHLSLTKIGKGAGTTKSRAARIDPRLMSKDDWKRAAAGLKTFHGMRARKENTMLSIPDGNRWPELPYAAWKDTRDTLHLWTQIVGKIRLAQAPWLNHSWHVALYLTACGLTTSPIPYGERTFQLDFDFIDHVLWARTSDGHFRQLMLAPKSVAEFFSELLTALAELGINISITRMPCEIADGIPFDQDYAHASYDRDYANRFWRILLSSYNVLTHFRTGFLGKVSPVHFFWGSFDLAVTRFSGRTAPRHPGGVPHLSDAVAREAYSHEVSSAGFWPGGGPMTDAAFYSYAYPAPDGFASAAVGPERALFSKELGEFILPYEAIRMAPNPERALMEFLQSTYAAAAVLGRWDRAALECPLGEAGRPRSA